MKAKTKQIVSLMKILTWVVFIGLCIKTGALLYSFLLSVFGNGVAASNLYMGLDLSELKSHDTTHYLIFTLLIIFISAIKALIFYFIIKIFQNINFKNPFSKSIGVLIKKNSYAALCIGIMALIATMYSESLVNMGVYLPDVSKFIYGGKEFLFFAIILFVVFLVFKIGIEYQEELEEIV